MVRRYVLNFIFFLAVQFSSCPTHGAVFTFSFEKCRTGTYDKPQRMIRTIVHELVKLLDSKIKDHLSLVPIDAEPRPIILGLIEFELKVESIVI